MGIVVALFRTIKLSTTQGFKQRRFTVEGFDGRCQDHSLHMAGPCFRRVNLFIESVAVRRALD